MSNLPTQHVAPTATPARVGQGTAVEQSRAVAEVQAAVVVAQQVPRRIDVARTAMQESCAQLGLADRAFYEFPRSGERITGPTVYLARELARCWGNVQHGIAELRRDDDHGESEMQAWAWDVQTNTRTSQTFIVPHKRDRRGGAVKLTELRDIYENNANQGARRLREAIFAILPPWFVEEAADLCRATLSAGDGRPLEERIAGAVAAFDALGITAARLEQKLGRTRGQWTGPDLAQLRITHKSIQRGELTVDEAFPAARVTLDELTAPAAAPPAAPPTSSSPPATPPPAAPPEPEPAPPPAEAPAPTVEEGPAETPPPAADTRNAAGQRPPATITARQIATRSAAVFGEHVEVGPRGGKSTRTIDRLRHAVIHAQTGGAKASAADCTTEELLQVWQRMDDIAEGRLTYELELEHGVAFVSGTGKRTTVTWEELEGPADVEGQADEGGAS